MKKCLLCRASTNIFSSFHGVDLLWEEQRIRYLRELEITLSLLDPKDPRYRSLKWQWDNKIITISNSYTPKETY